MGILALNGDVLYRTTQWDQECRALADRHYSRRTKGAAQFLYSGRKIVLRDATPLVVFAWVWAHDDKRMDGQRGYNCAIFRNESERRSSDIILEAERWAFDIWGPARLYTYVDGNKILSSNPGWCFQCAGWRRAGRSKSGLVLLTKELT